MSKLADAAVKAVTDSDFETEPGYCQRFVAQVIRSVYGHEYDDYCLDSAVHSAYAFASAGLSNPGPPQVGDILYKTQGSGGFGHVGIYVGKPADQSNVPASLQGKSLVCENSSTRYGRVQGAKGYREYCTSGGSCWGPWDILVRLREEVVTTWNVILPNSQILLGEEHDDKVYMLTRRWGKALGLAVDYNDKTGLISIGNKVIQETPYWQGDSTMLTVRTMAASAGLTVTPNSPAHTIYIKRP